MITTPRRTRKTVIKTKRGYRAAGYSRGGLLIRLAIDTVCRRRLSGVPRTIVLTSGTDSHATGAHPLPRCEAVDVRTQDFADGGAVRRFLLAVMVELVRPHQPQLVYLLLHPRVWDDARKVVTEHYFGQFEYEGKPRAHIHIQVRRGHTIGLEE